MTILIAADHGGFALKEYIKQSLIDAGKDVHDFGAYTLDLDDDYPDLALPLAVEVARTNTLGILICRNGVGVSIVANKVSGIRAVATTRPEIAVTSREDDDTNIICLGQDMLSNKEALSLVETWLATPFSNSPRHIRRLQKITAIERQNH